MICLYSESPLFTFLSIFYTFLYMPFLQIINFILRFLSYLFNPHQLPETHDFRETSCDLDLPVSRFQDLDWGGRTEGETLNLDEKEMCSICLIEFENEDLLNKLPRCGHLFHTECMEKWLDQCRFTCPLCRSLVFRVPSSPCENWNSSAFCSRDS